MSFIADIPATFWFPEQASTFAPEVDNFYFFLFYLSVFFFVPIVGAMVYFAVVYRRRKGYQGSPDALHSNAIEIAWTVIPSLIAVYIFARGAYGFLDMMEIPVGTTDLEVTARKWSWTFKYPGGVESNELHVVNERPTKLVMRSEDVLHSLFVPAFRVKCDVVPGRYANMWFQPTKTGIYDLFCTEYCGDKHSQMLAKVYVQTQDEYDAWFAKELRPPEGADGKIDYVKWGEKLFTKTKGCAACHSVEGKKIIGPALNDRWLKDVPLASGQTVKFDENYVRESVLEPQAKAQKGYETASQMPSYQGRLKEEEISALFAYFKSKSADAASGKSADAAPAEAPKN
jgi:cytochrome c oxidase subunit II